MFAVDGAATVQATNFTQDYLVYKDTQHVALL